jgi:hypothetical protein
MKLLLQKSKKLAGKNMEQEFGILQTRGLLVDTLQEHEV